MLIERAAATDLMELACDVGPVPLNIAGVLVLDPAAAAGPGAPGDGAAPGTSPDALAALVAARLGAVPRLRQRLAVPPPGCGRPVWVDDPAFDARRHVSVRACPAPGDEAAVLDAALAAAGTPLPRTRPLWAATVLTGLPGGHLALVVVLHHVVADGLGGLAMLAGLVDGSPEPPPAPARRPTPSRAALAADAWSSRLRALAQAPAGVRQLRAAAAEMRADPSPGAPRTSLNRPTGPRRAARVVRAPLAAVVDVAHAAGATVNDVLLTAVAGAVGRLLAERGESADRIVVSVPASVRGADQARPGNRVGVLPVVLPLHGEPADRLAQVAAAMRVRKARGALGSVALLPAVFRALAAAGVLSWCLDHQRLVNTFVSNLRGPAAPLVVGGRRVADLVALSGTYGNVTVSVTALSYAGTLGVTLLADPDAVPDLDRLAGLVRDGLAALGAAG